MVVVLIEAENGKRDYEILGNSHEALSFLNEYKDTFEVTDKTSFKTIEFCNVA